MKRTRGRPREYDPDMALEAALNVFWERGYAATSLTHLSEATGMNRPSLYAAFGDKHTIFLKSLTRYSTRMRAILISSLRANDLETALTDCFSQYIETFLSGQRGCLAASVAVVEAVNDPEARAIVDGSIERLESALTKRLMRAASEGLFPKSEAGRRGRLATAILHSLSIRARAGHSRDALREFMCESLVYLVRS